MASRDTNRPNVLFILSDDQGPWAMGCAGNTEIQTPNMDRIAKTGIRFDHFFCASPVCSPARASIITGRIPSQHGVHDWLRAGNTVPPYESERGALLIEYLKGMRGYTDFLAEAGYTCGISGKWHLGDCHHAQKSFSYWEVHCKGGGPYYGAPLIKNGQIYKEPRYVSDVFTDNAVTFLNQEKDNDNPFYLSVHYTAPHTPWARDQHPTDIYDQYYNNCPFTSVPDGLKPPDWVRYVNMPDAPQNRRSWLSGYFTAVTAMDSNIGRLLDWLEANNLRENTLVVFMADNGMNMGHHGVYGKGNATFPLNMFEEAVKVPFLVSRPGSVPEGTVCSSLLSQYDFMPTLLDYAGLVNPEADSFPGRSFAGILRGDPSAERDDVVVFDEYGPVQMIRSQQWKYVQRYPFGPHELYDLVNDPSEKTNLIDHPEAQNALIDMRGRLSKWFCQYVDPNRDGTHEGVTGSGQLGLCGPDSEGIQAFSDDRVQTILP